MKCFKCDEEAVACVVYFPDINTNDGKTICKVYACEEHALEVVEDKNNLPTSIIDLKELTHTQFIDGDLFEVALDAQYMADIPDIQLALESIAEAAKTETVFFSRIRKTTLEFMAHDFEKIWADYAAEIGKEELDDNEKRQAFLNHILSEKQNS